jgi:hypothetical protein
MLATFRRRVNERMKMALRTNQLLTAFEAEREVWQHLEEELLRSSVGSHDRETQRFYEEGNQQSRTQSPEGDGLV